MKTLAILAILTLIMPTRGLGAELSPYSTLAKFNEPGILKICKEAITKHAPKTDLKDLSIFSIEYTRHVDGNGVFPITLLVRFLQPSTRQVKPIEGSPKWSTNYEAVSVLIDPEGRPEKCSVRSYSFSQAHSIEPEP